jgi:hypothetical protein
VGGRSEEEEEGERGNHVREGFGGGKTRRKLTRQHIARRLQARVRAPCIEVEVCNRPFL